MFYLTEYMIQYIKYTHIFLCAQSLQLGPTLCPYGLQPARLLCTWNFSSKNTGVGCHFLLQRNLPDPGIEPASLASPELPGRFFNTMQPGKIIYTYNSLFNHSFSNF